MGTTVQVRKRGVLTLPVDLRNKYGISEGDAFRIVDVGGVFILAPMAPSVPDLAREIERVRVAAGVTTEELLEGMAASASVTMRKRNRPFFVAGLLPA